ncbi:upstream stimulatory factor 1-like isoform X2 [Liolophura sinensis]|uniref:upstream stimulatory factor 1-like isoform X2 n=1 Tax=Liolophura sinensis TaxID=3198878 RepID=UPI0031595786
MDMLDQALESSQEKTNDSAASDDQVAVHLGGQVTYRVVQVAQDGGEAQVVTSTAFPPGTQVTQAVIQSPFGNGQANQEDPNAETRFTYFPTVAGPTDSAVTQGQDVPPAAAIGPVTAGGGQFYVMMSPQDVLQGQRNIAPRTTFSPKTDGRTARDDRRRATHNEVERRRRDKINNWIVQLSKLVPDCSQEQTKQGQIGSKGGILAKACDYIQELRAANAALAERVKETERLQVDAELLGQQCEELKAENSMLRTTLSQNGIVKLQDVAGNPS